MVVAMIFRIYDFEVVSSAGAEGEEDADSPLFLDDGIQNAPQDNQFGESHTDDYTFGSDFWCWRFEGNYDVSTGDNPGFMVRPSKNVYLDENIW